MYGTKQISGIAVVFDIVECAFSAGFVFGIDAPDPFLRLFEYGTIAFFGLNSQGGIRPDGFGFVGIGFFERLCVFFRYGIIECSVASMGTVPSFAARIGRY